MIEGDVRHFLQDPYSIVVTEKAAQKLFGDVNCLGKVVTMGPYGDFAIQGVIKDIPVHSHMQFEVLVVKFSLNVILNINLNKDFLPGYMYMTVFFVYDSICEVMIGLQRMKTMARQTAKLSAKTHNALY